MGRIRSHRFVALTLLSILSTSSHAAPLSIAKPTLLLSPASPPHAPASKDGGKLSASLEARLGVRGPEQLLNVIVRYRPGSERAAAALGSRVARHLTLDHSVAAHLRSE